MTELGWYCKAYKGANAAASVVLSGWGMTIDKINKKIYMLNKQPVHGAIDNSSWSEIDITDTTFDLGKGIYWIQKTS